MKKALVCFLTLILVHVICACRVSVPKNQTVELVYKDSASDRKIIEDIFAAYGVTFPCT